MTFLVPKSIRTDAKTDIFASDCISETKKKSCAFFTHCFGGIQEAKEALLNSLILGNDELEAEVVTEEAAATALVIAVSTSPDSS